MGDIGSENWYRSDKRDTVEACVRLTRGGGSETDFLRRAGGF